MRNGKVCVQASNGRITIAGDDELDVGDGRSKVAISITHEQARALIAAIAWLLGPPPSQQEKSEIIP